MPVVDGLEVALFCQLGDYFRIVQSCARNPVPLRFVQVHIEEVWQERHDVVSLAFEELLGQVVRPGVQVQVILKLVLEEVVHSFPPMRVHVVHEGLEVVVYHLLPKGWTEFWRRLCVDDNKAVCPLLLPGGQRVGRPFLVRSHEAHFQPSLVVLYLRQIQHVVDELLILRPRHDVVIHSQSDSFVSTLARESVPNLPPCVILHHVGRSALHASARAVSCRIQGSIDSCMGMVVAHAESVCRSVRQDFELFLQAFQLQGVSCPPVEGHVAISLGRILETSTNVYFSTA